MTTMTTMTTSLLLLLLLSTVQLQVSALPNPSWPLENVDALYYTMRSVTSGTEQGTGTSSYRMSFKAPGPHCDVKTALTGENIVRVANFSTESAFGTITVADPDTGKSTIVSLTNISVPVPGKPPRRTIRCTTNSRKTNQTMCINPMVEIGKLSKYNGKKSCGTHTCDEWAISDGSSVSHQSWLFLQGTQTLFSTTITTGTVSITSTVEEWEINGQVDVSPARFEKPKTWGKCDDEEEDEVE